MYRTYILVNTCILKVYSLYPKSRLYLKCILTVFSWAYLHYSCDTLAIQCILWIQDSPLYLKVYLHYTPEIYLRYT